MNFVSRWRNWEGRQNGDNVSNVSASPIGIQTPDFQPKLPEPIIPHINKEEEDSKRYAPRDARARGNKSSDPYTRGTDITDKTPSEHRTLDGHPVARVIWETDKAVVFADDQGRFWRYLFVYGKAWSVVVEGRK
jgi:hypothetical protein